MGAKIGTEKDKICEKARKYDFSKKPPLFN
jgi:hypothetical protein